MQFVSCMQSVCCSTWRDSNCCTCAPLSQAFGAAFNFMSLLERQGAHVSKVSQRLQVQHWLPPLTATTVCRFLHLDSNNPQVIAYCRAHRIRSLDVEDDAEAAYTQFCAAAATKAPFMKCVSYYNQEVRPYVASPLVASNARLLVQKCANNRRRK
jgi:hypothetical protein